MKPTPMTDSIHTQPSDRVPLWRSPALRAALKSLVLPGLGQWHNGEIDKAAWWLLAFALLSVPGVALIALHLPPGWTVPALALGLVLALGIWFGSVVDAWRVARRAAQDPMPELDALPGATPVWRMAGVTLLLIVLGDFVALPLLIGAVRAHQVEAFRIPSSSMAPALWPGDFVFADKRYACLGCRAPVKRGDIVILAYPNDRTLHYVKRVIALPGDRVQQVGDALEVNGVAATVPDAPRPPAADLAAAVATPTAGRPGPLAGLAEGLVVPPGHVFVAGDRREASVDSRHFGFVPLPDVVGRVRQVWFSWGREGVRWGRLGRVVE